MLAGCSQGARSWKPCKLHMSTSKTSDGHCRAAFAAARPDATQTAGAQHQRPAHSSSRGQRRPRLSPPRSASAQLLPPGLVAVNMMYMRLRSQRKSVRPTASSRSTSSACSQYLNVRLFWPKGLSGLSACGRRARRGRRRWRARLGRGKHDVAPAAVGAERRQPHGGTQVGQLGLLPEAVLPAAARGRGRLPPPGARAAARRRAACVKPPGSQQRLLPRCDAASPALRPRPSAAPRPPG